MQKVIEFSKKRLKYVYAVSIESQLFKVGGIATNVLQAFERSAFSPGYFTTNIMSVNAVNIFVFPLNSNLILKSSIFLVLKLSK